MYERPHTLCLGGYFVEWAGTYRVHQFNHDRRAGALDRESDNVHAALPRASADPW